MIRNALVKEERADEADLGFIGGGSELKSSIFTLICCGFMKICPDMAL